MKYKTETFLSTGKNKRAKDELDGKIMTEIVGRRPKTHSYLIDDESDDKKAQGHKKCIIK